MEQSPDNKKGLSRRGFLRGGAALAGLSLVGPVVGQIASGNKHTESSKSSENEDSGEEYDRDPFIQEIKNHLKETYGINILVGPERGQQEYLGEKPSLEQCRATLRIFKEELSKYPPEMVQAVGEGRGFEVRVINHPTQLDHKTNERIEIAGDAPVLQEGKPAQMLLATNENELLQSRDVHHELNHRFAEKRQTWEQRGVRWNSFHRKFVKEGENPYKPEQKGAPPDTKAREPWFLNSHASTRAEEDQAICAEWMMTPSLHFAFVERINSEKDPNVKNILSWKYMETIENYKEWSKGKLSNQFWIAIYNKGKEEREKQQRVG